MYITKHLINLPRTKKLLAKKSPALQAAQAKVRRVIAAVRNKETSVARIGSPVSELSKPANAQFEEWLKSLEQRHTDILINWCRYGFEISLKE